MRRFGKVGLVVDDGGYEEVEVVVVIVIVTEEEEQRTGKNRNDQPRRMSSRGNGVVKKCRGIQKEIFHDPR
jgi:hypothetical protein